MKSAFCAVAALLMCGAAARATPAARSDFVVVELDYLGAQEKPVYPLCLGDSEQSFSWCADVRNHDENEAWFSELKNHLVGLDRLRRIINDVPLTASMDFLGSGAGKEIEITVVEHGALRHVFLKGDASETVLRKLIRDAGDTRLRHDLKKLHWQVRSYAGERMRAPRLRRSPGAG